MISKYILVGRLLVNDFPGLEEVFAGSHEWPAVDLDNQEMVTARVLQYLESTSLEEERVSSLAPGLDLQSSLKKWCELIDLCA